MLQDGVSIPRLVHGDFDLLNDIDRDGGWRGEIPELLAFHSCTVEKLGDVLAILVAMHSSKDEILALETRAMRTCFVA